MNTFDIEIIHKTIISHIIVTINTMNNEYYSHMHLSAGNDQGQVFGGHLNKAIVSATCEMVIQIINGEVDRYFDEEVGLNLLKL